jgi:stage II sporulation protein D
LVPSAGGLAVVNVLPVEDYLKGVLKMEVNPAWPMEALKAQAIVARTYAIKHRGRHKSEGFDLCALPHCQVYRGVNAEDPKLDQAIKVTSGMVITYQGNLALVFYHADSGGYTADAKDVWGGSYPYLRPIAEPFSYQSPYSQWSLSLSLKEIENRLRRAGFDVGALLDLQFENTSPGGRVDSVILNGSMGTQKVSGHAFRMAIGPNELRSTAFSVDGIQPKAVATNPTSPSTTPPNASSNVGENTLIALTKQGCFTPDELIDMLMHPEKRQHYVQKALSKRKSPILPSIPAPTVAPAPMRTAEGIVRFYGRGWGHGVGMSQWGAKAMAEQGWSARQILNHYYPNTEISKLY